MCLYIRSRSVNVPLVPEAILEIKLILNVVFNLGISSTGPFIHLSTLSNYFIVERILKFRIMYYNLAVFTFDILFKKIKSHLGFIFSTKNSLLKKCFSNRLSLIHINFFLKKNIFEDLSKGFFSFKLQQKINMQKNIIIFII